MDGFLRVLLTLPAVPFTVLMGIAFLYWIFVLMGVVAFDGDGALEGGAKAAGDALTGGLKAAGEAVAGGAKAAGDAVTGGMKAAAEVVTGAEGGGEPSVEARTGVLSALGFGRVPSTISGSFLVFFAWVFSMFGSSWLGAEAELPARLGVMLGAALLSVGATSLAVRPLVKAFESAAPQRRHHFIGKVCEITSGKVDAKFGTATVSDGGAGLNLNVVCEKTNQLKKGDRALIVGFDDQADHWEIEPLDWLEPQELEALKDPEQVGRVLSSRMRTRG